MVIRWRDPAGRCRIPLFFSQKGGTLRIFTALTVAVLLATTLVVTSFAYGSEKGARLSVTIPAIGIHKAAVGNSVSKEALDRGIGRHPETSLPWSKTPERNVYLAAHRIGVPGTKGHLMFWRLPDLDKGDRVILSGRGKEYRYRVTKSFVVTPQDRWVMGRMREKDMVTLQTCVGPSLSERLIVRAERV